MLAGSALRTHNVLHALANTVDSSEVTWPSRLWCRGGARGRCRFQQADSGAAPTPTAPVELIAEWRKIAKLKDGRTHLA